MNTVWSDHIQGVMTLYLSRKLRFDDVYFDQYEKLFALDRNAAIKILEIGCGPGALAEALRRWYPKAEIVGIDRDSRFVAFAKERVPGVEFIEGDAARLPFDDNEFNVTISNTVQEHVEPGAFWGEQRRVLKQGCVCLCLSARKGLRCAAPCLSETNEERAFWESVKQSEDIREAYGVGAYAVSEAGLPAAMERHGFMNVSTGYAVIDLTPDDPKYGREFAEAMIEAERRNDIEAIGSAHSEHAGPALEAVGKKYDERLRLLRAGVKQWDTNVCVTMVARGISGD